MADLRLIDGDLQIVNGDVAWVRGGEAIAQNIETRVRCFFGENTYAPAIGVPWLQAIFGRDATPSEIRTAIEATIRTVRGVDAVTVTDVRIEVGLATVTGFATTDGREIDFTTEIRR